MENSDEIFAYPEEIRKIIYTSNPIKSLNFSLRKVNKNRAAVQKDDAVLKLKVQLLAFNKRFQKMNDANTRCGGAALNQFAIYFGDRVSV